MITITISKDKRGIFWARRPRKHVASKTYVEAKANAKQLFEAAGGEGKAVIEDLTEDAKSDG